MPNDAVIKPTTDLFIATLWSAPEREPILRSLLNGVMTDIGQTVAPGMQRNHNGVFGLS